LAGRQEGQLVQLREQVAVQKNMDTELNETIHITSTPPHTPPQKKTLVFLFLPFCRVIRVVPGLQSVFLHMQMFFYWSFYILLKKSYLVVSA
jgi:hypothetical protein